MFQLRSLYYDVYHRNLWRRDQISHNQYNAASFNVLLLHLEIIIKPVQLNALLNIKLHKKQ